MRESHDALRTREEATVAFSAGDEVTSRRIEGVLTADGFAVAVAALSVEDLVACCADEPPDALALATDLSLLERSAELRLLRMELPEPPLVVISNATGRQGVRKALRAGAAGYVYESDIEVTLTLTLLAVLAGQLCVPQDLRSQIEKPAFSYREKQVLELVARGYTNGEIAQALFLSESTVKSHLSSSFRKLGVRSRAEAAAIVLDPENRIELGMFTVPGAGFPVSLGTS